MKKEYLEGKKIKNLKENNMTNYGTVTYEGKEYALIQQAYIGGVGIEEWRSEEVYYLANAIDSEGNEYEIEWELNEYTKEVYNEIERQRKAGEIPNYSLVEDESTACDWDRPVDVREI